VANKNNSKTFLILISLLLFIAVACSQSETEHNSVPESAPVNIKEYKTTMPQAEGYDEFETYCRACHSLRYIQMQPDFPKKKWEAIVDKMVKTYGAPIPDSSVQAIIHYLMDVKGKD
jgi:cytochrome c5